MVLKDIKNFIQIFLWKIRWINIFVGAIHIILFYKKWGIQFSLAHLQIAILFIIFLLIPFAFGVNPMKKFINTEH